MTSQKWVSYRPIVTVGVFASIVGLIAFGCTSIANPSVKQPNQGKNSQNNPPYKEEIQVNQENFLKTFEVVGLQQGMPYKEARKLLIQQGWQANLPIATSELPNLENSTIKKLFDLGYEEIKDCSGTGLGLCRFEFTNERGELLVVSTTMAESEDGEPTVRHWFIEEKTDHTQPSSLSNKIVDGFYALGGTDLGIEVKGEQYRHYDELGVKEWKPIAELEYVREGVIFNEENYWCLSTLAPQDRAAVCSANGWTQI